jgi:PAS domain S-box-containing protein
MVSRVRVLHVDDEPGFAGMVAAFLERADGRLEVATAGSASEGLEHLEGNGVDCVVSDYDMPGGDGLEFLERVRAERSDLPFVLFTGKGSEEIASEAVSAGVTDYLQKTDGVDQYELLARRITNAVERRRAERTLEGERRRFTKLTEHSTDVIVIVDERLRFSYVSASVEPILGHVPGDLVGEDALGYVHPDDRHVARGRLSEVLEHPGTPVSDEVRLRNADGSWTWIEARARNALEDPDVGGVVIYSREISRRKDREREIRGAERRFGAVFEAASDAMLLVDDEGGCVEANPAACELFGLEREALLGRRITDFAPDDSGVEVAREALPEPTRDRGGFPLVRADGELRTVEYAATSEVLPGEHLSVLRPVADRSAAELNDLASSGPAEGTAVDGPETR